MVSMLTVQSRSPKPQSAVMLFTVRARRRSETGLDSIHVKQTMYMHMHIDTAFTVWWCKLGMASWGWGAHTWLGDGKVHR